MKGKKILVIAIMLMVSLSGIIMFSAQTEAAVKTPKLQCAQQGAPGADKVNIRISYSKVSDADGYEIFGYYQDRVSSEWIKVKEVTKTSFEGKVDSYVYGYSKFKVRAYKMVNGSKKYGKFCKAKNADSLKKSGANNTLYYHASVYKKKQKGEAYKITVNGNKFIVYGSMSTSKTKWGKTTKVDKIKKHVFKITSRTKFVHYSKEEFISLVESMNGLGIILKVSNGNIVKAEVIS